MIPFGSGGQARIDLRLGGRREGGALEKEREPQGQEEMSEPHGSTPTGKALMVSPGMLAA